MITIQKKRYLKNTIPILVVGMLLPQILMAADFRGVVWGDDMEAVKIKETEKLIGDHQRNLIYQGRLAGVKMYIVYEFRNRRLIEGSYHNQSRHADKNEFIRDHEILKDLLQKKYGSPVLDRAIWTNDTYRADASQWGTAISLGHLSYVTEWETYNTKISAVLGGKDSNIQHVVKYTEKRSEEKEQKEREKRILEKL